MEKGRKVSMSVLRSIKGVSQKQLAYDINVSPGLIGMYETGKRKPSLEKAIIIAKYFNTPVENILFGKCDCVEKVIMDRTTLEQSKQMTIFDLDTQNGD